MKILIAATACHPTAGSEAYVGWQSVSQLRQRHDLWVLTSGWCREGIEAFLQDHPDWENVRFVYVDRHLPHHPNRLVARIFSWTRYRTWCRLAEEAGRKLAATVDFDLAHHVTYATWRMGSPLACLGIPWVWGPIGGGERFPWQCMSIISLQSAWFELLRSLSTWTSYGSSAIRRAARHAAITVVSNRETDRWVGALGTPAARRTILSQAFLDADRIASLRCWNRKAPPRHSEYMAIIAGGNLEARKGVSIALRALALAKKEGVLFQFRYLGGGPEQQAMVRLAAHLGLAAETSFDESLSGSAYAKALGRSHVFLLPSLRESAGLTLMEAMTAGCVPLVADCGGPSDIARQAGLPAITVSFPSVMARHIAKEILALWNDPALWMERSRRASSTIASSYSSDSYAERMEQIYFQALHPSPSEGLIPHCGLHTGSSSCNQ